MTSTRLQKRHEAQEASANYEIDPSHPSPVSKKGHEPTRWQSARVWPGFPAGGPKFWIEQHWKGKTTRSIFGEYRELSRPEEECLILDPVPLSATGEVPFGHFECRVVFAIINSAGAAASSSADGCDPDLWTNQREGQRKRQDDAVLHSGVANPRRCPLAYDVRLTRIPCDSQEHCGGDTSMLELDFLKVAKTNLPWSWVQLRVFWV